MNHFLSDIAVRPLERLLYEPALLWTIVGIVAAVVAVTVVLIVVLVKKKNKKKTEKE